MPRFHFNTYDGIDSLDPIGIELEDWRTARMEAVRRAGKFLRDDAHRIALGEVWRMEVTDDKGLILFRLDFSVLETPAMLGTHRSN